MKQRTSLLRSMGKKIQKPKDIKQFYESWEQIKEMPRDKVGELLKQIGVSDEDIKAAKKYAKTKKHAERMISHFKEVITLAVTEQPLGIHDSLESDYSAFIKLSFHCEQLWSDACKLFLDTRYATAKFLSIVALEEIGKAAVGRVQVFINQTARIKGDVDKLRAKKRSGKAMRAHRRKHLLAASAGAVINSRLDRLFGERRINKFIQDAESGHIETFRQEAVYYDIINNNPIYPADTVNESDALFYVIIVGELLAEVCSLLPDRTKQLLDKVAQFEKQVGFNVD